MYGRWTRAPAAPAEVNGHFRMRSVREVVEKHQAPQLVRHEELDEVAAQRLGIARDVEHVRDASNSYARRRVESGARRVHDGAAKVQRD
eukprot:NODE_15707_length_1035_cov_2.473568.p5 GENE.NODE_15707_length_1035_cov_2.473568~~NODE_15707_length_1035_cov_2.473568.p5  ORF type:complete len:89 (+),score=18.01 NODE_15707_length_1035_cov_2.473568:372-638(+)